MQETPPAADAAAPAKPASPGADTEVTRLAVTLGDPRGIGPEVVERAACALRARDRRPHLVFIGPVGTGAEAVADEFIEIGEWKGGAAAGAGLLAGRAIEAAARLAMEGKVDAIVTAPIDKLALNAAGFAHPGHTEMLAELAHVSEVAMMMAAERTVHGGPLRVVLATTHLPLREVARRFTEDLLVRQVELTASGVITGWQINAPRIALCAFNPHASDGGMFGDEEARVYAPAMQTLASRGLDVYGPLPADTVFLRAARGEFDAVVAPYHDVGMAAFKTAAFGHGVNVTLGLPFVRTSPDHGTALDIAGTGQADASSMLEAIDLAERLATRRRSVNAA